MSVWRSRYSRLVRTAIALAAMLLGESLPVLSADHGAFLVRIRAIDVGESADLDVEPDGVSELANVAGEIDFSGRRTRDDAAAGAFLGASDAPVWRLKTSAGATAWVQVVEAPRAERMLYLSSPARQATVRWIVGPSGAKEAVLPPQGCKTRGGADLVELKVPAQPQFSRVEVEWSRGVDGPRTQAAVEPGGTLVVAGVAPGERICFRVTGVLADGRRSVPVEVAGAPGVNGVRSGSMILDRSKVSDVHVDLVRGVEVESGGDVRGFTRFRDAFGRVVAPLRVHTDAGQRVWPGRSKAWRELEMLPMAWMMLPLRGGGVARIRVVHHGRPAGFRTATLVWDLVLDASELPSPSAVQPQIRGESEERAVCIRPETAVRVRLEPCEALRASVELAPLASRAGAWLVPAGVVATRGRVSAVDSSGRRSTPLDVVLAEVPSGSIRTGTFDLRCDEGFDFVAMRAATGAPADFYQVGMAGGGGSGDVTAPFGIASYATAHRGAPDVVVKPLAAESIRGVVPEELELHSQVEFQSHEPGSRVFVLPLCGGGWCRIVKLDSGKDAKDRTVVRYAYTWNPNGSRFCDAPEGTPRTASAGLEIGVE